MIIIVSLLVLAMLTAAVAALIYKDLLSAIIASCLVSLLASILFFFLQAPDVAMAEASIGAALVTAIFVIAIRRTKRYEE
jgi:multicomponent Na+:H+ antiporter subunit A